MNPRRFRAALVLAAALGVAGCAPYASVSSVRPSFRPAGSKVGALAPVERRISTALRQRKREPLEAIGGFLAAAQSAQQQLVHDPANIAARDAYNFAVARVIGTIQQARLDPWTQPLRVPAADGDFMLTANPTLTRSETRRTTISHLQTNFASKAPTFATRTKARHRRTACRHRARREPPLSARPYDAENLLRRHRRDPIRGPASDNCIGRSACHRARHFRRTPAFRWRQISPRRLPCYSHSKTHESSNSRASCGQKNTPRPPASRALQPYDPNKTVVLIIHGLKDSPATWVPMFNHLIADEQIRRKLPTLVLQLPDGLSVSIFRRDSAARARCDRKPFPAAQEDGRHRPQHGGCISRLLITDTGDKLWREIFKNSPGETAMPPESKALLTQTMIFRHDRKSVA